MLFPDAATSKAPTGAVPPVAPTTKASAKGGFTFSPPASTAAAQPQTSPEEAEWVSHVRKANAAERTVKTLDDAVTDINSRIRAAKNVPQQARLQAALAKILDERKRADEQAGEETILAAVAQKRVGEAAKAAEAEAVRGRGIEENISELRGDLGLMRQLKWPITKEDEAAAFVAVSSGTSSEEVRAMLYQKYGGDVKSAKAAKQAETYRKLNEGYAEFATPGEFSDEDDPKAVNAELRRREDQFRADREKAGKPLNYGPYAARAKSRYESLRDAAMEDLGLKGGIIPQAFPPPESSPKYAAYATKWAPVLETAKQEYEAFYEKAQATPGGVGKSSRPADYPDGAQDSDEAYAAWSALTAEQKARIKGTR